MPSFDVVSELDKHELTNAVDNAIKELDRRFDLRGKCSIESKDKTLTLTAEAEVFRAILDGEMNPTMAFMTGKLSVDGNMGLAMQLGAALG